MSIYGFCRRVQASFATEAPARSVFIVSRRFMAYAYLLGMNSDRLSYYLLTLRRMETNTTDDAAKAAADAAAKAAAEEAAKKAAEEKKA